MPSIRRRTYLGAVATGTVVGLAGCSSSCPDSDHPVPSTVVSPDKDGSAFETLPGGAWPRPRFDAGNTGYAPSRRPPIDAPSVRWRTSVPAPTVDGSLSNASSPVVADGRVYLATGAGTFALALRDGTDRWRTADLRPATTDDPAGHGDEPIPPVVDDGRVYVATTDGVAALHADDGSVAWRYADAAATGVPAVVGDGLVLPTTDGVVALDVRDGTDRWTAGAGGATTPAVDDGTVVVAGESPVALDAATGDRLWDVSVRTRYHPVVTDGTVVFGTDGGLVGLDLEDGRERWRVDRGGGRTFSPPVVTPETIYAVERPGEASDATFALDRVADGPPEPRWCSAVGDGAVTAATDDHAFALQTGGSGDSTPARLLAFTERFGEATWGYAAEPRHLAPAVLDGGVVTTDRHGTVVALGGA